MPLAAASRQTSAARPSAATPAGGRSRAGSRPGAAASHGAGAPADATARAVTKTAKEAAVAAAPRAPSRAAPRPATGSAMGTATGAATRAAASAASDAAAAAAPTTIALLQSASLSSAAQQEIERMILDGELPPGTKLTEQWLSQRLGVSRGPIREAFRMLEEAGLVRQEKNRGVFVRDIPLEEAVEIYDLRAVMDELVGRRLAEQITPQQLRQARAALEQMERAARDGDADVYHLLNLRFHDALVEATGNRKMTAIYRKLVKELALFRRRNLAGHEALAQSVAEHRAIVRAVAAGDSAAAGHAMFRHVGESKARMLRAEAALPADHPVRIKPAVRRRRN
jgi:phosphonate utilization transcriptional regulator